MLGAPRTVLAALGSLLVPTLVAGGLARDAPHILAEVVLACGALALTWATARRARSAWYCLVIVPCGTGSIIALVFAAALLQGRFDTLDLSGSVALALVWLAVPVFLVTRRSARTWFGMARPTGPSDRGAPAGT